MDAKLIKMLEGYIVSLTGDIDDIYAITNKELAEEHGFYSLSLKNCQAIELDYDLDELADFYGAKAKGSVDFKLGANQGFEDGFQKALEILGDKKFSERDLRTAYNVGYSDGQDGATFYNKFIQSLQQTEWKVEICCHIDDHGTGNGSEDSFSHPMFTNTGIPKYDADGNLILKRKVC